MLIDELDRSLHPQMTIKFVETFLGFSLKKHTSSESFTTHESNLMDLNILRRDEIWFAEKDQDNQTNLYTLEKLKSDMTRLCRKIIWPGGMVRFPVLGNFEYVWGGSRQ